MILWFNRQLLYLEFLDLRQKHFAAIVVVVSEIIGDREAPIHSIGARVMPVCLLALKSL